MLTAGKLRLCEVSEKLGLLPQLATPMVYYYRQRNTLTASFNYEPQGMPIDFQMTV